jgi:hypothetical protein
LILLTGAALASMLDFSPMPPGEILLAQRAIADTETTVATPVVPSASEAIGMAAPPPVPEAHKSVGRAFLYNLVLPGAGHLYAGNKRGFAHLGLEGVAWVTYFYYHERGTSKEDEYLAYGYDYPPAGVRIAQLDEYVQIIKAMWTQECSTFEGHYYSVKDAYMVPRPDPLPTVMIGTMGSRIAAHLANAGDKGGKGTDNRDKTRQEDGLPTVFLVERMRPVQVFAF